MSWSSRRSRATDTEYRDPAELFGTSAFADPPAADTGSGNTELTVDGGYLRLDGPDSHAVARHL